MIIHYLAFIQPFRQIITNVPCFTAQEKVITRVSLLFDQEA